MLAIEEGIVSSIKPTTVCAKCGEILNVGPQVLTSLRISHGECIPCITKVHFLRGIAVPDLT
jgi:hypothetical protein